LVFFAWKDPDFNRQKVSDWNPVLALAQASDLIEARGLYSRAGRIATWQDDWTGILAAACGQDQPILIKTTVGKPPPSKHNSSRVLNSGASNRHLTILRPLIDG